jgi:hypothetical protein
MLRRGICLVTLGAFLLYAGGCYTYRQVQSSDVEAIKNADVVMIVTTDDMVFELTRVQVDPPWIAGQGPYKHGQPLERVKVHLDDIKSIEVKNQSTGLTLLATAVGLAAGACLLYALVVVIILLTKESCPFIYAYDGSDFRLEGELYSGAVFKAIERKDYLRLHHLVATESDCRIKISNEAHETQNTDELTLLAVDHPLETEVIADRNGKMLVLSDPQPPISAEDFKGKEVTKAVRTIDRVPWVTNPLEKNPNESADLKDGIIVQFDKPDAINSVQLAVRIGNTFWADYIFGRYTALYGYLIDDWYENRSEDLSLKKRAERFMRENGLALNVQVLSEESWEDVGYFYPTGPIALQDDVLEFEPPDSDILTIRLVGGSFFWMIDYVAVDWVEDPDVDIHRLSPIEAVDEKGSDVRELLAGSDDRYYTMPRVGNHATVTYSVPPPEPGRDRTFIVQSEGYYTIHREKGRMPDIFALAGIRQGPEGFLQYSLREFQRLYRSHRSAHAD